MKPFLILSTPEDVHTRYVSWALKKAGCETILLNSANDGYLMQTSLHLGDSNEAFPSSSWDHAEAVWCRRLSLSIGSGHSGDTDDEFVREEQRLFTRWLIGMQELHSVRWINFPMAAQVAENKFVQLKVAKRHGINVPRTLVTANPAHFRSFLSSEGSIVAKPLGVHTWELGSGKVLSPYATIIDGKVATGLSDEDVEQCVTMYQQLIHKTHDVRMIILGSEVFAYKVIQEGTHHFDYREGFHEEKGLRYEALAVPSNLQTKINSFMQALDLNFASADFALTEKGDLVFLDLNPSGQWMFIEAGWSESRVGQRFCSFLVTGSVNTRTEEMFPSVSEYWKSDAAV